MQANPEITIAFLTRMYSGWSNLERELAWSDSGQDAICNAEKFAANDVDGFAQRAAQLSDAGANVYFTPALFDAGHAGRGKDAHVAMISVLWADLDSAEALKAPAKRYGACSPTCSVMTRPTPDVRLHYYWRLSDPIHGKPESEGRRLMERIAAKLCADQTVTNPARLLRVPGTVRHPTPEKPIGPYLFDVCYFGDSIATYTRAEIEAAFPPVNGRGLDYGVGNGTTPEEWAELYGSACLEGTRNVTATKLFGYLLRKLGQDGAWVAFQHWNECVVRPPLGDKELWSICDSICGAEAASRRASTRGRT